MKDRTGKQLRRGDIVGVARDGSPNALHDIGQIVRIHDFVAFIKIENVVVRSHVPTIVFIRRPWFMFLRSIR